MRWRINPLGCLVGAAIFVVFGVGMVVFVVGGSFLGGGGGPLTASGFQPGPGAEDSADRRDGGSVGAVPTWRERGDEGDEVSFSVLLRNGGSEPVEVTGVERDPDGDDQLFDPVGLEAAPVRLAAGEERRVEVAGRIQGCARKLAGQISLKNGQTFVVGDGETQNVDFGALLEILAPPDTGCPERR